MKKAAVFVMEGYEESETMTIVDLLRRANIETHTIRFQEDPFVYSMQGMYIRTDEQYSKAVNDMDIVIVPGGRTAWQSLIDTPEVMDTLKEYNTQGKWIAGMCSGTKVLHAAGVLKGKKATGYSGYKEVLTDAQFVEAPVVCDQNVITSVGPATPYPFAFKIIEALGEDPSVIKDRMLYSKAKGK